LAQTSCTRCVTRSATRTVRYLGRSTPCSSRHEEGIASSIYLNTCAQEVYHLCIKYQSAHARAHAHACTLARTRVFSYHRYVSCAVYAQAAAHIRFGSQRQKMGCQRGSETTATNSGCLLSVILTVCTGPSWPGVYPREREKRDRREREERERCQRERGFIDNQEVT